jgi:probable phosphoglycerate mutase
MFCKKIFAPKEKPQMEKRDENRADAIRILLIRHGETDWNHTHRFQGRSDVPLNRKGVKQAEALGSALKLELLAAIYTSPLSRAAETARIIGSFHPDAPIYTDDGLIEMDLGDFDGIQAPRWADQYPEFLKEWRRDPSRLRMPGGETLSEVQSRAIETLGRIIRPYDPGSTLAVACHNFVILSILCSATRIPLSRLRELRQETAAFSVLYKKGEILWAELINSRAHLEGVDYQ